MSRKPRTRTPTKLRALRGNPGKRPLPPAEPEPRAPAETPPPPAGIGAAAARVWRRLAPELHTLGLLTVADLDAFAAYCTANARWREAEKKVRELGTVIKSPNGYPIQNPFLAIANKAQRQMAEIGGEFGLTPSSRTRLQTPKAAPADPLAAFAAKKRPA